LVRPPWYSLSYPYNIPLLWLLLLLIPICINCQFLKIRFHIKCYILGFFFKCLSVYYNNIQLLRTKICISLQESPEQIYHSLGTLNSRNLFWKHSSGSWKSKIKVPAGLFFQRLPSWACKQLYPHLAFSCACVPLVLFHPLIRTQFYWIRAQPLW
jgi:hypothetical protein